MKNTSKTLVFFGNERLVSGLPTTHAPVLVGLIEAGYTIKAVVSHHTNGLSRSNRDLEIAHVAKAHDIPVLLPENPADILEELKAMNADAAILVAYGRIIPQAVIDIFPRGIINIHPSLLPKYRGPTPIESVIVNGDRRTGISIMQLTAALDEGPIYDQKSISLDGNETKSYLYEYLSSMSKDILLKTLPSILDGTLSPEPQDKNQATYSQLLTKSDGIIDPTKTAQQLEREVRAYQGWPKSRTEIAGNPVIITKTHVAKESKTPLDVPCGDGAYLSIDELIAPSGRTMNATAFLNGYAAG